MQKKINGTVMAVDLGSSKIKVIAATGSEEYFEVIFQRDSKSNGIVNGEVINIKSVAETLNPIFERFHADHSQTIAQYVFGISGYQLRTTSIKERVTRSDSNQIISDLELLTMMESVKKEGERKGEVVLEVIPQYYNVDDNMGVEQASGMTGSTIEGIFKVISLKEKGVLNSRKLAQYMGLENHQFYLAPIASALSVLTPDELDVGAMVLDFGAESVEMVVCHNNKVREVAVVPFGGNSITSDLSHFLGTTFDRAEAIKLEHGCCIVDSVNKDDKVIITAPSGIENEVKVKDIAEVIEARVAEITDSILYLLERSGYSKKLRGGVVLTGGGSYLIFLDKYLKEKFNMDVRVGSPELNFTNDKEPRGVEPYYSITKGLIERAFSEPIVDKQESSAKVGSGKLFDDSNITVDSPTKVEKEKTKSTRGVITTMLGTMFDNINNGA